MSALVRTDSTISNPNSQSLQRPQKKPIILSGRSILGESVPILGSVEYVFARVISKFLPKLDKADMDRFFSLRRRIPERFVR